MLTKNNFFQILLFSGIHLLSLRPIIGYLSLKLESGVHIRCFENERQALLKFKREIVDEFGRLSTWEIEENKRECCKWEGVCCNNRTNHVTLLDLRAPSGSNRYKSFAPLQGKVISPSLLELQHLECLDLSLNNFDGASIPDFIGSLKNLCYLNLSYGNFNGSIPHHIGNLSKLQYLSLDQNRQSMYSKDLEWLSHLHDLKYLNLNYVNLSMATNWLQSLSKLNSLKELHLKGNHLTEQLSEFMMNLSGSVKTKLQYLDFSWNKMSGSFPDVIKFSSLKELRLSGCELKGSIPPQNLRLPNLVVLDLSDNNLTGPLPDLSFSTSLKVLILQKNKFSGTLTKSIGGLSKLEKLYLGSNLLEGIITEDHLFNLSQLRQMDLSSNSLLKLKFSHQWVPPFQLEYLSLASCEVGPQFPKWIRNKKKLFYLDISNARISDTIPTWLAYLSIKLIYLNASNNQIIGSFPKITHNWNRSTYLPYKTVDLSRNKVSGSVTFLCYYPDLSVVDLSDNQLSNKLPECFAKFEYLNYLNLANNNFSGKIPDSFGSLSALSFCI